MGNSPRQTLGAEQSIPRHRPSSGSTSEIASIWRAFQYEQECCRITFAKLSKIQECPWAYPWLDWYNEALKVRHTYLVTSSCAYTTRMRSNWFPCLWRLDCVIASLDCLVFCPSHLLLIIAGRVRQQQLCIDRARHPCRPGHAIEYYVLA
jgi:hypothetical protein